MKSRIVRTILGVLCVLAAFSPGALAISLYVHVIQPGFNAGSHSSTFVTMNTGGWEFHGNEILALAIVAGVAAVMFFLGGLFLIFFWPREDSRRVPPAD